jgi:hypothetical protein
LRRLERVPVLAILKSEGELGMHTQRDLFSLMILAATAVAPAFGQTAAPVCAENTREYYAGRESAVPRTNNPDF